MNNKVVIGGNLKLKNTVSGQAKLNNVISGTPNISIRAGGRGGISNAVKEALLNCFEHVAWVDDDGQVYYQALYDALYAKVLSSISASFEQGQAVIYDDDTLDDLKQYLTVTANYDDGSMAIITTYTLSGTLNPGTSSIQVSYENKKAYFTVNVTHRPGILTITNTLNGCTTSNSAASMTEGDPYSATITASSGYILTGASVSITMGGVDITSTAYNNGTISIAEVTGSLVITITAVAITLVSISAVYTQSGTVYDTDTLDSLKSDLVVTATYSDSTTEIVPSADYTLSGTLAEGTSTISVTYEGKTTTFTVTVRTFRVLTTADIISHLGSTVSVDQTGTITVSNIPTSSAFSLIILDPTITKIRGVSVAKDGSSATKNNPKIAYAISSGDDYYIVNPGDPNKANVSTKTMIMTSNGSYYSASDATNGAVITPTDWSASGYYNAYAWQHNANYEYELNGGTLIITNLDTNQVASVTHADRIGFWVSQYSSLPWLKNIQVG